MVVCGVVVAEAPRCDSLTSSEASETLVDTSDRSAD